MADQIENFTDELYRSIASDSFIKLTLSNYKGVDQHLQKVTVRIIDTRRGRQMSFQSHYETRQTVKNHDPAQAVSIIRDLLTSGFRSAHLFTSAKDHQLTIGKRSSRLVSGKPTYTSKPATSHDRKKRTLIDPNAYYLKALGITTETGQVLSRQQDKWRQINKYVEVLRDLFEHSPLKDRDGLSIIDMGSGKGYLTFAAYDYFANVRGLDVEMTGIDSRSDMIELCNQIAAAAGYAGLRFVSGTIVDFEIAGADILIALHACDTATDEALYKGISSNAEIIVAAPCCHKELRRQIEAPDALGDILKHGSLLEREAETITDGIRSMLLERSGYATRVFEFISVDHTPKNNMIVATRVHGRQPDRKQVSRRINDVMSMYGISQQRLENLLA